MQKSEEQQTFDRTMRALFQVPKKQVIPKASEKAMARPLYAGPPLLGLMYAVSSLVSQFGVSEATASNMIS